MCTFACLSTTFKEKARGYKSTRIIIIVIFIKEKAGRVRLLQMTVTILINTTQRSKWLGFFIITHSNISVIQKIIFFR